MTTDYVQITLQGEVITLDHGGFAELSRQVDTLRRNGLMDMPPFEDLKHVLEITLRIGELDGDERTVWELLTDRIRAVSDSGLLKACGLEDGVLWPAIDEGYREETSAMLANIRSMIKKVDGLAGQLANEDDNVLRTRRE